MNILFWNDVNTNENTLHLYINENVYNRWGDSPSTEYMFKVTPQGKRITSPYLEKKKTILAQKFDELY